MEETIETAVSDLKLLEVAARKQGVAVGVVVTLSAAVATGYFLRKRHARKMADIIQLVPSAEEAEEV